MKDCGENLKEVSDIDLDIKAEFSRIERLELLKIKRLGRIADALRGIDQGLDCISGHLMDIEIQK